MFQSRIRQFVVSLANRSAASAVDGQVGIGASSPSIDLLDANVLAKVGQLELVSQHVVDGVMSGVHRSAHKGGCCEFADHRPYAPGDETRLIDWRMFARRDRFYIKQFEDETNLQAWMVVDCSGSMRFGSSTATKFNYARTACACIGRLLLKQRDAVGLSMDVGTRRYFVPAKPEANHFQAIVETLRNAVADGQHGIQGSLEEVARRAKRRGLVLVFSDCFGPIEPFVQALKNLRLRGHDVLVFQVLAPEELSFQFRRSSRFLDLEGKVSGINVNPSVLRRGYLERFQQFMTMLHEGLTNAGCDRVTLTTDEDLGDAVALFLRRRMAS